MRAALLVDAGLTLAISLAVAAIGLLELGWRFYLAFREALDAQRG